MTRTVFMTATTLNGFLADDDDSLDWLFAAAGDDESDDESARFLEGVGCLVMGSATYEWLHAHERLDEHPEKWEAFHGSRPTWVFTTRALPVISGAPITFVSGPPAARWSSIRASAGGLDVWIVGGGDLAGQFADAGLLDELRLSVAPVTLPSGKPLLPRRIGADRLRLVSVGRDGVFAELVYAVDSP